MMVLIKKPATKLNIFYCVLTALLYGGFWFGYYFLSYKAALWIGISIVVISLIFFLIFQDKTFVTILFGLITGLCLGLCISAYFTHAKLIPSRFFGLVLLIFLAIKCLQAYACSKIPRKKLFLGLFILVEIIATIIVIVNIDVNHALNAQILYALAVSMFLSLGQIGFFSREYEEDTWGAAAIGLLIGYVIIVLIIISIIAEDGSAFEGLDFGGGGGTAEKKKQVKNISDVFPKE